MNMIHSNEKFVKCSRFSVAYSLSELKNLQAHGGISVSWLSQLCNTDYSLDYLFLSSHHSESRLQTKVFKKSHNNRHLEHRSKPMFRYSEYRLFSKFNFSLSCIAEEQVWSSNTGCFEGGQNSEGAKRLAGLASAFIATRCFDAESPLMFLKKAKVGRKCFLAYSGSALPALFCKSEVHWLV